MASIPAPVAALLGPNPEDRSGRGAGRVLSGNGRMARIGPPEVIAREVFVLGLDTLPVTAPPVVDAGEGWVVCFLAYDVPELAGAPPWLAEHMVNAKAEAANRLLG